MLKNVKTLEFMLLYLSFMKFLTKYIRAFFLNVGIRKIRREGLMNKAVTENVN